MTTEPENLILRKLQEMRAESSVQFAGIAARDEKTQAQIGSLAEAVVRQTKRIDGLSDTVATMVSDLRAVAMVVDHHTSRLDSIEHRLGGIERHLGLDESKH